MVEESDLINEMKEYAKEYNVPIMSEEGIGFLTNYCKENKVRTILEIGTAIAYSTILLAKTNDDVEITSIERDEKRYLEAIKNVKKSGLENRIDLIFNDALEVEVKGKYDLIFIDAAKAQNIKFFEKFKNNLNEDGTIITDNMKFHGLVDTPIEQIESRNLRQLIRKIRNYKDFLDNNTEFTTSFYDLGDGVAISKRKINES